MIDYNKGAWRCIITLSIVREYLQWARYSVGEANAIAIIGTEGNPDGWYNYEAD